MNDEWDEHGEPVKERYRVDPRLQADAWNYGACFGLFVGMVTMAFIAFLWSKAP